MKTKNEELCELLDYVFDSREAPDFAYLRELAFRSEHSRWLIAELLRALWLCAEDQAAFDEYVWRVTNGNP